MGKGQKERVDNMGAGVGINFSEMGMVGEGSFDALRSKSLTSLVEAMNREGIRREDIVGFVHNDTDDEFVVLYYR